MMTERPEFHADRFPVAVDRATRIVRLLAWTAMFALVCLMLWIVSAQAQEDPRAAARAIGTTGMAAAGAIARDAAKAADVPGYAGTDLPERGLTDPTMAGAAQRRLADPADPGGLAGRTVSEGAAGRPDVAVTVADPGVARGKAIAAAPEAPVHGAGGLASGSVSACGARVADANRGGACGSVRWCVGAACGTVASQANTGFAEAATRLNLAVGMGGEGFDPATLSIFTGKRRVCHIHLGGLANCCTNSGLLSGLANCSASEVELAQERRAGTTRYLGSYCSKRILGVCLRRSRAWCVFSSKLGRILHEQARPQLGIGWGSCRGFTVPEVERIDFAVLDLSEFTDDLLDGAAAPAVALPEAGGARTLMENRVRDFYRRNPR